MQTCVCLCLCAAIIFRSFFFTLLMWILKSVHYGRTECYMTCIRLALFPTPPFCKWKCKAIFGESWCHKWFEQRAYNCWSRLVWQSDKPWRAPVADWDLAKTTESEYFVFPMAWMSFFPPRVLFIVVNEVLEEMDIYLSLYVVTFFFKKLKREYFSKSISCIFFK